jgi:hypothetical protein
MWLWEEFGGSARAPAERVAEPQKKARDRPSFGAQRPSLHRNVALYYRPQMQMSGRRAMRILHLNTKQVELARVLFSIGMTAFLGVGTFVAMRYLIGFSE